MKIVERQRVNEQDSVIRSKNFEEVSLGFDEETMLIEPKDAWGAKPPLRKVVRGRQDTRFYKALKTATP